MAGQSHKLTVPVFGDRHGNRQVITDRVRDIKAVIVHSLACFVSSVRFKPVCVRGGVNVDHRLPRCSVSACADAGRGRPAARHAVPSDGAGRLHGAGSRSALPRTPGPPAGPPRLPREDHLQYRVVAAAGRGEYREKR